jgi:hypothetical protein
MNNLKPDKRRKIEKLEKYRGAVLYEKNEIDPSEGALLTHKVLAKGAHPDKRNMLVDFVAEAESKDKAVELVKEKVDHYLGEHNLQELKPIEEDK